MISCKVSRSLADGVLGGVATGRESMEGSRVLAEDGDSQTTFIPVGDAGAGGIFGLEAPATVDRAAVRATERGTGRRPEGLPIGALASAAGARAGIEVLHRNCLGAFLFDCGAGPSGRFAMLFRQCPS